MLFRSKTDTKNPFHVTPEEALLFYAKALETNDRTLADGSKQASEDIRKDKVFKKNFLTDWKKTLKKKNEQEEKHVDLFLKATFGMDALLKKYNENNDISTSMTSNSNATKVMKNEDKIENAEDFISFLYQSLDEGRTLAISDDYSFWAECKESDDSGKLLFVEEDNESIENGSSVYSLFFDDNIERHCAHIVDVRSTTPPYSALPFNETKNKYLFKCEPYYAILDKILELIVDKNYDLQSIKKYGFNQRLIRRIWNMLKNAEFKFKSITLSHS